MNLPQDQLKAFFEVARLGSFTKAADHLGLTQSALSQRIQLFQDEIIGWLQDEKEPTQIVQLGTYLVPMTKKGV